MEKFHVGQRVVSERYGLGTVRLIDKKDDTFLVEYDSENNYLGTYDNVIESKRGKWYLEFGRELFGIEYIETIDEYRSKPFTRAEVEAMLAEHVEKYHAQTSSVVVPDGWNTEPPSDYDNVEIMFEDGETSIGYRSLFANVWLEFEKEYWKDAVKDVYYLDHCHTCDKTVIAWRYPHTEQKEFKRGDRVVMFDGNKATFVEKVNFYGSDEYVVLLDDGFGWKMKAGDYGTLS